MQQQDLFGGDEPRQRLATEMRASRREEPAARAAQTRREGRYGTEPHKLARRDGPDTSKAAAKSVNTTTAEAMVHRAIHGFGENGCIVADLFKLAAEGRLGNHAYSFTARLSGLKQKGFITAGPDTRPGPSGRQQQVLRSVKAPIQ